MGYLLEAVVGRVGLLREAVRGLPGAVCVELPQEIAIVPVPDSFEPVGGLGFRKLPALLVEAWSADGPVGYVEAEYFAGVGTQRAALWSGAALALGPLSVEEEQRFAVAGSPISQVLRALGVDRTGHFDEFDAVGLGRHRRTEDWCRPQ